MRQEDLEILTFDDDDGSGLVLELAPVRLLKAVGPALDGAAIEGYAATWQPDYTGDRILPGAFDETMARHAEANPHFSNSDR
jgi:hypothetical protein